MLLTLPDGGAVCLDDYQGGALVRADAVLQGGAAGLRYKIRILSELKAGNSPGMC